MEIGVHPKDPNYIAFKKGILSDKEFRRNIAHERIARLITSGGYLGLGFFALPVGLAVLAVDLSLFCLNEHFLTKEYEAREGDIAIEDIEEVYTMTPQEVKLKGNRIISASQEQIEILIELKEISPSLNYKIIR